MRMRCNASFPGRENDCAALKDDVLQAAETDVQFALDAAKLDAYREVLRSTPSHCFSITLLASAGCMSVKAEAPLCFVRSRLAQALLLDPHPAYLARRSAACFASG